MKLKIPQIFKKKEQSLNVLDEKKLVDFVEDRIKSGTNNLFEQQCYINIAYYSGKQWIAWDKTNKRITELPKEKAWRTQYTANKIQPLVRTERAKILKNKPVMWVAPASNEDNDIKSTKIAEKFVEWCDYELKLSMKDSKLVLWGLNCGIAFMKPYWDGNKGTTIPDPITGEVVKEGDVAIEVVNPLELKWDPVAEYWEDVRWCCHEKARDVGYIKDVYRVEVVPEDGLMNSTVINSKLRDINMINASSNNKMKNAAVVKEYWEMPSSQYPKGRRITIANGKMLFYEEDIGFGEKDDSERELPFFPFVHIDVPGKIEGTCVVEQTIPIQREYNKSRSKIIEYYKLMGSPMWAVEANSLMNGEPGIEPDEIIEYKQGSEKPSPITMPSMSMDIYKNLEMCNEELEFGSGQHETSHGSAPAGVKSGIAIQFLQEQDDTKLGPTIANFINCKLGYTRYLLKMIRYNYTAERTIRIVGENKKVETYTFCGSDITSNDVRVQEGSMFQLSRAAKQDFIMALVDKGLIADKTLALKMLDLGITDDLYDEYSIDLNDAQEENDKWKQGDVSTQVRDFDNHEIHIKEHDKLRKTKEYDELSQQLQQFIDLHVAEHDDFLLQKMQMMMPPQPMQGGGINAGNPM